MLKKQLNWIDPLDLAQKIADNYSAKSWIFLYSGLHNEVENSNSIIALFPHEEFLLDNLDQLKNLMKEPSNPNKSWFGYISYEAKNEDKKFCEIKNETKSSPIQPNINIAKKLSKTEKSFIDLPKIWLLNFSLILTFDHDKKLVEACFSKQENLDEVLNYQTKTANIKEIQVTNFDSNFLDEEYLKTIEEIREMIMRGDFYQTNLTRKFYGNIANKSSAKLDHRDYFKLFTNLNSISPANYSSFLKLHDNFIISSSPELFFLVKNREIISRPIKGTAARSIDVKQDQENKKNLQNSDKERAENLMIVDLVRNDISRICKAGSVIVKNLFKVNSYKTLHHMSSEITGKIADEFDIIDCLQATFPAGSMTGAPKIKAMEIIAQKEKLNRGIYSGAIGYFNGDEANFSVVIRTLICQKNKFEFQVGGAITYDSKAEAELEETKIKAHAIKKVLGII